MGITEREAIEELAKLHHDVWVEWAKQIMQTESITPERLRRWLPLVRTPYEKLPEPMKEKDRIYARKAFEILKRVQLAN